GTAPRARASEQRLARRSSLVSTRASAPSGRSRVARTLAGAAGHAISRRRPAAGDRARSPFFCVYLLEHVNLQHPIGEHLFQLPVFGLETLQPLRIIDIHGAELLAPLV